MTSTQKRDITPLIMWLVLFAGIIVLAFIRFHRLYGVWREYPDYLDAIFIGLYLLWMVTEFRITNKDVNTEGKKIIEPCSRP